MKNKFVIVFSIFTVISTTFSQNFSETSSFLEKLSETWFWIKSVGGQPENIVTPATYGYNLTVEFSKDSIYRIYKDDSLKYKSKFTIDFQNYLKSDGLYQSVWFKGRDTLYLNDVCPDCQGHVYVRKKL
jgi:hypothetical protein